MKQKGFSLIELLVVIVVIGLLALISVPTFAASMKKTKDTERQVFVRELHRALLSWKIGTKNSDFRLGATNESDINTQIKREIIKTGYSSSDIRPKDGIHYYYFLNAEDITVDSAHQFFVFACKQESLGSDTGGVWDVAHVAGSQIPQFGQPTVGITGENARAVCAETPIDIDKSLHTEPGWTAIKIQ